MSLLLDRHMSSIRDRVHRRLGSMLRAKEQTDDLVQDAVVRFLVDCPRFEVVDEEHFRLLLARVVENTLRDKYNWHQRRRRDVARECAMPSTSVLLVGHLAGRRDSPSGIVEHEEQKAWVRLALDLLDAEEREIIVARDFENHSFAVMAGRLEVSEGAARMRYHRAVAKITRIVGALRRGRVEQALAALGANEIS
ncbi:MAG: sigma-70 family RNA polymerase sigma factor [Planctomycetes bacterium]|nr:sigma-70 family RNA polymerase sigma factor [Planctomycetota bacterium]